MPRTVFFDVNETLSDTTPLTASFSSVGAPSVTPTAWLAATLRDGCTLALTMGPTPFADVAEAALGGLLSAEDGLVMSVDDAVQQVMAAFSTLPVHDDVAPGIHRLHDQAHRLVTFSNRPTGYTQELLQRAGVEDAVDAVLSVEDAGVWKTDRRAYEYALTADR